MTSVVDAKPDPLAAWRPTPQTWLGVLLLAGGLVVYPSAIDAALARFGTRPVAAGLLALALVVGALRVRPVGLAREALPRVPGFPLAIAALPLAALVSGDQRALVLVSAAVHLWLALLCAASLREPISLVERAARVLQPRAPEFIRSYCRKVTALWGVLFATIAWAIAWLAFAATPETRRAFSAWGVWTPMAVVAAVEYVVRKSWFRYYASGFADRLWARWLPAENSERGRRSLAYIRQARAEMRAAGFAHPSEGGRP